MSGSYEGLRVAVTGASGFIGSRLVERLGEAGAEVYGVARGLPGPAREDRWWRADVSDPEALGLAFDAIRPDVVFHLAGLVTGERASELMLPMLRTNLVGTVNVLAWVAERGCARVVIAGSMEEPAPDATGTVPASPYAASKAAASSYARMAHALYDVPAAVLRVFMTYGPGQRDGTKLVPYVTSSLLRGDVPRVTSGARTVDWVFVDDVADAFVAAGRASGIEGTTLDVGTGRGVPVRTVVEMLAGLVAPGARVAFGAVPDRPLETEPVADVARSTQVLAGWRPRVRLEVGLARTVAWYRERVPTQGVASWR